MKVTWPLMCALLLAVTFAPPVSAADVAGKLRDLVGFTVLSVSSIRGTFNGCENGRPIALEDGRILICESYGYQYAYAPSVVLFGKRMTYAGRDYVMMKMLVEDEIYDMRAARAN